MQNHTFLCTIIVSANEHSIHEAQTLVRRTLNCLFDEVMDGENDKKYTAGITGLHGIAVNRMESS